MNTDDEDVTAMFTTESETGNLSFQQSITGNDYGKWKASIDREYVASKKNQTWTLVPLPQGRKVAPCCCVYKFKLETRAEDKTYKSRLVAKGFRQVHGLASA